MTAPVLTGRRWVIPLPYDSPPLTLNSAATKGHWSRAYPAVQNLQHAGFYLAKHHGVPRLARMTVELVFWPGNNRVHDADNLAPMLKALMDGIRKAGVVPDDRARHVRQASLTVIERDDDPDRSPKPRMALVIREVA